MLTRFGGVALVLAYLIAYCSLIAEIFLLAAGYRGSSTIFTIKSAEDCRRLIRRGWIASALVYVAWIASLLLSTHQETDENGAMLGILTMAIMVVNAIGCLPMLVSEKANNSFFNQEEEPVSTVS